jgi:hypothetical protein
MSARGIRRRCERLVRPLTIPDPFDVTKFCAKLGENRRKRIQLVSFNFRAEGPTGLWIATAAVDYVFYEQTTSPLHRTHIILHEIGHLLCDHQTMPELAAGGLGGDVDSGLVQRVSARAHADSLQEREAELIAYLIHGRIAAGKGVPQRPAGDRDADSDLARIAESLNGGEL